MAEGNSKRCKLASRRSGHALYPHSEKNCSKLVNQNWADSICAVCMECPHNAVLILCSSHDKGCRPYMCDTDIQHSNCFEKFKKNYAKTPSSETLVGGLFSIISAWNHKDRKLACPLCRGLVKGWTVVEPARAHLNTKEQTCMHDNCSFIGTYRDLQKHVRMEHSSSEPGEVDLVLEQKWNRMEIDRDREDVISTIRSSNPRAVFFGDFVIEGSRHEIGANNSDSFDAYSMERSENVDIGIVQNRMPMFLHPRAFGAEGDENEVMDFGTSLANRLRRQGRVILGRSQRRRRRRDTWMELHFVTESNSNVFGG